MKQAFFRVDGSHKIGLGHLFRTISVAKALHTYGFECHFFIKNATDVAFLVPFSSHDINDENEIDTLKKWKERFPTSALIVDLYDKETTYFSRLRILYDRLIIFSDHDNFAIDASLIIHANHLKSKVKHKGKVLKTPRYFPLNPAFSQLNPQTKKIPEKIEKIAINFGGSDLANNTQHILKLMKGYPAKFIVIMGAKTTDNQNIALFHKDFPNLSILSNLSPEDMAQTLYNSDLLICAGGSTAYEALCVGVPSIVTVQRERQIPNAKELEKRGLIKFLGLGNQLKKKSLIETINKLQDPTKRQQMKEKGKVGCDGKGSERIADEISRLFF